MTLELAVARYNEDLQWLRRVPQEFRITVYNKGDDTPIPHSSIPLANIGHEAHTYLHHIVTRYEDLADVTVFCQGKPFDHVPDFHRTLRKLAKGAMEISDFLWLGFIIDRDDPEGSLFKKWHPDRQLPMTYFWRSLFRSISDTSALDVGCSVLEVPSEFIFFPGGQFAVTATCIRSRDLSFYKRALEISAESPDMAHCFERCWDRVFGVNGIPPGREHSDFPVYLRPVRRLGITWHDVPDEHKPWR